MFVDQDLPFKYVLKFWTSSYGYSLQPKTKQSATAEGWNCSYVGSLYESNTKVEETLSIELTILL